MHTKFQEYACETTEGGIMHPVFPQASLYAGHPWKISVIIVELLCIVWLPVCVNSRILEISSGFLKFHTRS